MNRTLVIAVAVTLVVGLVIGYGIGGARPAVGEEGRYETHTIVALLPLTGALSTFGENSKETVLLAATDVNAWLEREGKDWRLDVKIEDTATDGPTALAKMKAWYGTGVTLFVGPQASGECKELLTFANANKILFISQSSTSPALSIPDDYLFRFCPDDFIQGPAIARVMWDAGIRHVIFSWRGDTWGDGLQKATEESFKKLGGQVFDKSLRYDPGLEDFPKEAALLNDYVQELIGRGVPKRQIGIVVIAFEEIAPYMEAADKYPLLKEVLWFGSDGSALSEALAQHPVGAEFAARTKYINTFFAPGLSKYPLFDYVRGHVFKVLGRETDAYSYNAYDQVWALALAIDEVGYDAEKVKEILPRVTDEHTKLYGASGHIVLNENGDRAFADYDLWVIGEDLQWKKVGVWRGATDTIDWLEDIY